ncbi:MAG: LysR family transcriptional regulator [Rhizobacter sp.]
MDRLQTMQTFVRVVEAGSFSAVAREAGSTQSAISKQVAALERQLGARLLSRTTRSLALTEEGQRYFEQAQRLVAEIEEAESVVRGSSQQLTGWLRVAAAVGFGRMTLLPIVQSFLAAHPGVKVDLRLNDGFVDLIEEGIDVAVRVGELADSSLVARRVGQTRRLVVASRDYVRRHAKAAKAPREPADLLQHNCIVYTELATRNEWRFVAGAGASAPVGTTQSVRVAGNIQSNSSEVVRAAVLDGHGVGYSPSWLFSAELQSGQVNVLLPDWQAPALPMHLVSPPARKHSAKVRLFGDHVAAALKGLV